MGLVADFRQCRLPGLDKVVAAGGGPLLRAGNALPLGRGRLASDTGNSPGRLPFRPEMRDDGAGKGCDRPQTLPTRLKEQRLMRERHAEANKRAGAHRRQRRTGNRRRLMAAGISFATAGVLALDVLGITANGSRAAPRPVATVDAQVQQHAPKGAGGAVRVDDSLEVPTEGSIVTADAAAEESALQQSAVAERTPPVLAERTPPVFAVQLVPTETVATLRAGGSAVTVASLSGTGAVTLGFTRTSSSTAPNLPTYVSTMCDGASVYSGAFNTTTQGPVVQDVPYSGAQCSIRVRVAQPSARWAGTTSAIVVTRDDAQPQAGIPYVERADWTTAAVPGSDAFRLAVPEGFTGAVSVKLTSCSSQGGTSDATRDFACGDLVQRGVGSEGTVTVSDGEQILAETDFDISAETHHDMVTVDIADPAAGDLTIVVERSGGSAVLVHGPGTGAVGTF